MTKQNDDKKTLVLTGASRGIGHATVKRFSEEGWRVITCSRHAFPKDCPWPAGEEDHLQINLSDQNSISSGITELLERLDGKPLHALVNNAAISPKTASAIGVEAGDFVWFRGSEICVEVCIRVLVPDEVVLVYPGNRAAGVHFNFRDIGQSHILERVETAPEMIASPRLGLSQLLVNDLFGERG